MNQIFYTGQEQALTLSPIRAQCERQELQELLLSNPDCLPGHQIDPDDPRQWLPIATEFQVNDPTGKPRWSIDYICADQDAVLTLVECKRFADARTRREVVAQVMEYAANIETLFNAELILGHAESMAAQKGGTLASIMAGWGTSSAAYAGRLNANIEGGKIRLVFFVDEAPWELKQMVRFMKRAMPNIDTVLVEALQYALNDGRIVIPQVFGYVAPMAPPSKQATKDTRWNDGKFTEAMDEPIKSAVLKLVAHAKRMGLGVGYGRGAKGTVQLTLPIVSSRPMFAIQTDGELQAMTHTLVKSDFAFEAREHIEERFRYSLGLPVHTGTEERPLIYGFEEWSEHSDLLANLITELVDEYC
ncbi:hypothetical protein KUW19_00925 [Ferrimonas balearica]|uniref:hypothetical protein n=1 Tax=Ferrimonas balearica TaxID=44012 RepID=UPI001C95F4EA|nr:hypothetical protein [Ferrimonas balearica]MBY6105040.1 hypothetical protein [Ferrimonas balearica]